jgi:hypothetical protein
MRCAPGDGGGWPAERMCCRGRQGPRPCAAVRRAVGDAPGGADRADGTERRESRSAAMVEECLTKVRGRNPRAWLDVTLGTQFQREQRTEISN